MRRVSFVAVLALIVMPLTGCHSDHSPGPGEARLSGVVGTVERLPANQSVWQSVTSGVLKPGDHVRAVGPSSRAVLAMTDGDTIEIREGSELTVGGEPSLNRGDALVVAAGRPMAVAASTARALVDGAAHLSRTLAFEAAAYTGTVTVSSAGRQVLVPALRQATVSAAGLVPDVPQPLHYRDNDTWDRRYLGDAIDLGRDLESRSRGLTGQLPADGGTTVGFFQLLLPKLDGQPAFTQSLLDAEPAAGLAPGEHLVGAAIALQGTKGNFVDRWDGVFSFRKAGAEWGLVALDQGLEDGPRLVSEVDLALGRLAGANRNTETAEPGPSSSGGSTTSVSRPTTSGSPSTTPTTRPGATSPRTTSPRKTPPTTQPLLFPEPTNPPPGVVNQLVDPLVQIVGGLLNALLGSGSQQSPSSATTSTTVVPAAASSLLSSH